MTDRVDLAAGIASTACHLALVLTAWIATWDENEPAPTTATEQTELVSVPELLPVPAAAPVILPAEAEAPEERGATDQPTELPPLGPDALDFEPQAQRFTDLAPEVPDLGLGEADDHDHEVELPAAVSPLDELRASARQGDAQAAQREREELQITEARHLFAGWLLQTWSQHWQPRFGERIRNRELVLLVSLDPAQRVLEVRIARGTGIEELDTLIELHIREQARQGEYWTLSPMPDTGGEPFPFAVRLPE